MKFTREPFSATTIRHVERGRIRIGNEQFEQTLAVTVETIIRDWPAIDIDRLEIEHFAAILASEPDVVVLGTGWQTAFAPRELIFAMARRGTGFEVMDTPAACRTFNILLAEGRHPAAILIID
ncbi:MAG: hypothetical protein IIB76_11845 [Proteobacteria bacterium]|nr:hypothetical protein [Pseudomonadota bacterium]